MNQTSLKKQTLLTYNLLLQNTKKLHINYPRLQDSKTIRNNYS